MKKIIKFQTVCRGLDQNNIPTSIVIGEFGTIQEALDLANKLQNEVNSDDVYYDWREVVRNKNRF
jgi:hypothetical protein